MRSSRYSGASVSLGSGIGRFDCSICCISIFHHHVEDITVVNVWNAVLDDIFFGIVVGIHFFYFAEFWLAVPPFPLSPFLPSSLPPHLLTEHLLCILACTYHASLPSKQFRESLINLYCSLLCNTIRYDDLKMLLGQGEIANCDTTDFKNDLIEHPLSWHWGRLRANSRLANIFSESTWKCDSFAVCRKIKGCQLLSQIALESFVLDFCWF